MGQYKVPQDVEAEDKILGPYTLKQFIYAVIGVAYGFLTFRIFFSTLPVLFFIIGVPPTILMLMLGLYQRKDQPFEALFLALVSYWTKPRKRIWLKEPITEVFKIVQPKIKEEVTQKDPNAVRSQLEHVAQVIDTRGATTMFDDEGNEVGDSPLLDLEERLIEPSFVANRDIGGDNLPAKDMLDTSKAPAEPVATVSAPTASEPAPAPSTPTPQTGILNNEIPSEAPPHNPGVQTPATSTDQTLNEGQSVSIRNG